MEKALQRDKDKFTRLLQEKRPNTQYIIYSILFTKSKPKVDFFFERLGQEYNDCAFELLDLLDEVLDRSLITQIKSKIDYWSQIMESQVIKSASSSFYSSLFYPIFSQASFFSFLLLARVLFLQCLATL